MISKRRIDIVSRAAEVDSGHESGSHLLSAGQFFRVAIFAILFWFVAALFVNYGSQAGFFGGIAGLFMFVITVPVGWLSVKLLKKIASLHSSQMISGIATATAVATFFDGIALTWMRSLYGSSAELVLPGAAWILWGVGVTISFAYLEAVADRSK